MSPPDGDERLLKLTLDLKGGARRRRDWISVAERARALSVDYGGRAELASRLRVSTELLRALISLTDLPSDIQQMVRKGEILFDSAQRLNTIKDPNVQLRVATAIRGLPSRSQREAIKFAKRNRISGLSGFIKRLEPSPDGSARLRLIVVSFTPDELSLVRLRSRKLGVSLHEAIRQAALTMAREK